MSIEYLSYLSSVTTEEDLKVECLKFNVEWGRFSV